MDGWDYDSNVLGKIGENITFKLTASRIKAPEEVQFSFKITGKTGNFMYDSRKENLYAIEKSHVISVYDFYKEQKTENFFDFTDSVLRQDIAWIKSISCGKVEKIATFEDGCYAQEVLEYFLIKK